MSFSESLDFKVLHYFMSNKVKWASLLSSEFILYNFQIPFTENYTRQSLNNFNILTFEKILLISL